MNNKRIKFNFRIMAVVLSAVILVSFFYVGRYLDRNSKYSENTQVNSSKPYIEIKKHKDKIYLVNDVVKEWLKGEVEGEKLYKDYSSKGRIISAKSPIIQYGVYNVPLGATVTKQEFKLALNKDYKDAKVYNLDKDERDIRLDYLNVGKKYYYKIIVHLSDESKIENKGSFETERTPRILSVSGALNFRDVGGYLTKDGKEIRQDLLYRGAELDGVSYSRFLITDEGVDTMLNNLKIKSEFDLRKKTEKNSKNMLGEKVKHNYYGFPPYDYLFTDKGKVALKNLFSDLAKPEMYPVYMHCTYGKDMTGSACYLLHLLLGVDEEQAYKEWELSVLLNGEHSYSNMNTFIDKIKNLSGETMQEKTHNFLLEAGVTQQEIDSIKEIFVEQ